jgi:hypothetical protein
VVGQYFFVNDLWHKTFTFKTSKEARKVKVRGTISGEVPPLSMPLQIFDEPDAVSERLRQLGLDEAVLRQARQQGLLASLECTASHAPNAAGTYAYHEIVRALRDLFRPFGWSGDDRRNRGLLTNEDESRAIAVASGDENTGRPGVTPCTRNPKGITTIQAIRDNSIGWLFSEMEEDREAQIETSGIETWMLLTYRDLSTQKFRSELSLPISINGRRCPDQWRERIILDVIDFDDAVSVNAGPNSPSGSTPEINVEIRRRA